MSEVETEANARQLDATVFNALLDLHNFARKRVVVERERGDRGSYRVSQSPTVAAA